MGKVLYSRRLEFSHRARRHPDYPCAPILTLRGCQPTTHTYSIRLGRNNPSRIEEVGSDQLPRISRSESAISCSDHSSCNALSLKRMFLRQKNHFHRQLQLWYS